MKRLSQTKREKLTPRLQRILFVSCGLIYVLLWKCNLKTILLLGEKPLPQDAFTVLPRTRFTHHFAEGFLLLYDGLARIITLGFYQPDMHYRFTCWLRECAYGFLDHVSSKGLWIASPITMSRRNEMSWHRGWLFCLYRRRVSAKGFLCKIPYGCGRASIVSRSERGQAGVRLWILLACYQQCPYTSSLWHNINKPW